MWSISVYISRSSMHLSSVKSSGFSIYFQFRIEVLSSIHSFKHTYSVSAFKLNWFFELRKPSSDRGNWKYRERNQYIFTWGLSPFRFDYYSFIQSHWRSKGVSEKGLLLLSFKRVAVVWYHLISNGPITELWMCICCNKWKIISSFRRFSRMFTHIHCLI